jgi:hypothetical protein
MQRSFARGTRFLLQLLAGVAVLPALVATLMMTIAWQDNPQDEFHGPDGVQWDAWLAVGWATFLVLWVPLAVLALVLWRAGLWWIRRRSDAPAG